MAKKKTKKQAKKVTNLRDASIWYRDRDITDRIVAEWIEYESEAITEALSQHAPDLLVIRRHIDSLAHALKSLCSLMGAVRGAP